MCYRRGCLLNRKVSPTGGGSSLRSGEGCCPADTAVALMRPGVVRQSSEAGRRGAVVVRGGDEVRRGELTYSNHAEPLQPLYQVKLYCGSRLQRPADQQLSPKKACTAAYDASRYALAYQYLERTATNVPRTIFYIFLCLCLTLLLICSIINT